MDAVLFILTSFGYKELTLNLLKSLNKSHINVDILIFCVDNESKLYFDNLKYKTFKIDATKYMPNDYLDILDFGSLYFQKITYFKFIAMELLLKTLPASIRYIIYIDGDIVVFRNFMPYIRQICDKKDTPAYLFQVDEEDITISNNSSSHPCSGFIIVDRSKNLAQISPFELDDKMWEKTEDQLYLQYKLQKHKIPYFLLDRDLFQNGVYLKQDTWKNYTPFLIHYNWMMSDKKENTMKHNKHWYLE